MITSPPASGVAAPAAPEASGARAAIVGARSRRDLIQLLDVAAFVVIGLAALIAVLGPFLAPADPYQVDVSQSLLAPGAGGTCWAPTTRDGICCPGCSSVPGRRSSPR